MGKKSIADPYIRRTVLLEKCNYNQCCMNTFKVDLFIHAVEYFCVHSWASEQPADVAHNRLLGKAKSHKNAMVEYHLDKESRKAPMALPATDCTSIDAVHFSENYKDLLPGPVTDVPHSHYFWPFPCLWHRVWQMQSPHPLAVHGPHQETL